MSRGSSPDSIAVALAAAARTIHATVSTEEALDAIARAARASVPGFDHVGVSISHRDGRLETLAGTDQLVWELDSIQYSLDEGPCVGAIRESPVVAAEDIRHDQRWPRYVPQAVDKGVKAQMGLRLYTHEGTLGGLNLYSTSRGKIDPDALLAAEIFATHAALALGHARKETQLNDALASRKTIGQAIGILTERYQINDERAFQFLVRASSASNLKLRDIAEELAQQNNHAHAPGSTENDRPSGSLEA
jgi:transcriptional regulator with GAF, ATPase, and Fis domain